VRFVAVDDAILCEGLTGLLIQAQRPLQQPTLVPPPAPGLSRIGKLAPVEYNKFPKRIRLPREAYANRENAFHIVMRSSLKSVPFVGVIGESVWHVVMEQPGRPDIDLVAACLMPDHLHVILQPAERSVIAWANAFKSYTTAVGRKAGGPTYLWQPSYYDRRLRDDAEREAALQYVAANPAEAGLVAAERTWPWLFIAER
jgi:REP element-mobilizing transposase RayT